MEKGCSFQLNANDKALGRYPYHPTYFQNIFLLKVPGFVIFICGNFCSMAGCLYFVAYSVHLFIFTPRFAARGKRKETCFFSTTTNQPQSKHEGEQRYPAPKQQRIQLSINIYAGIKGKSYTGRSEGEVICVFVEFISLF